MFNFKQIYVDVAKKIKKKKKRMKRKISRHCKSHRYR